MVFDFSGYESIILLTVFLTSIFIIVLNLGLFILRGFGLRKLILNNDLGEDKVVLGFIPVVSDYLIDEITSGNKNYKENTLGSITFVSGILSVIFGFFSIIYGVSYLILCHKFFKAVNPKNYVLLNVLNVITFGLFSYVYIFINRNFVFNYNIKIDNNDININEESCNRVNLSKEI